MLDLCGRTHCLIADRDGVYDPSSINGRLLLGLKGQISELELHTIRARLTAGIQSKAQRGELEVMLPTGLERLANGDVVKTPDREVQDRLTLIFETMLEKQTAPKVLRVLKERRLKIPRRDRYGDIQWREPTTTRISGILRNPAYAGAFAYGRTRLRYENGLPTKKRDMRGPNQWRALVKDKYPTYVSWDNFEMIRNMLQDNHSEYQSRCTRGIPRDGKVLLQGIAYCGHCGRKMTITYKDKPRYNCVHRLTAAAGPVCQTIWSDTVDPAVLQCFFEALSVTEIDLSARTLQEADLRRDDLLIAQKQQVERLRHAAHLADRQFRRSDPDNRLVTAELERRWEVSLRDLRQAEDALEVSRQKIQAWAIPEDLLLMLKDIGPRLPELWNQPLLSWSQKKGLLRSLVEKVVFKRNHDEVDLRIVWQGADVTELTIPITVGRFEQLRGHRQIESTILALVQEGRSDKQIARHLTQAGYRSPRHSTFLPSTVTRIRHQHKLMHSEKRDDQYVIPGYLRPRQLAARLQIQPYWINDRIRNGTIKIKKHPQHNLILFPDVPKTFEKLRQLLDGQVKTISF